MTEEEKQQLINVREAAKECGRNMETVRRWIWSGKLPAEKLGNQLFIKKEDLANYCRETAVQYRAELEPDFLSETAVFRNRIHSGANKAYDTAEEIRRTKEEQMNQIELKKLSPDTGIRPGGRTGLIKKMRRMREEIRARVGNLDAAETIEQLRQERMNELTGLR